MDLNPRLLQLIKSKIQEKEAIRLETSESHKISTVSSNDRRSEEFKADSLSSQQQIVIEDDESQSIMEIPEGINEELSCDHQEDINQNQETIKKLTQLLINKVDGTGLQAIVDCAKKFLYGQNQQNNKKVEPKTVPTRKNANLLYGETIQKLSSEESNCKKYSKSSNDQKNHEQRQIAKHFVEFGYGIVKARQHISDLQTSKYNYRLSSIVRQSLRLLEQFLIKRCGKKINIFTYDELQLLRSPMVNMKKWMSPDQVNSFNKFIKASYGIATLSISQREAIALYDTLLNQCQKRQTTKKMKNSKQANGKKPALKPESKIEVNIKQKKINGFLQQSKRPQSPRLSESPKSIESPRSIKATAIPKISVPKAMMNRGPARQIPSRADIFHLKNRIMMNSK